MILTRAFVFLNNPRTGSTFVRTVLRKVHEPPLAVHRFNLGRRLIPVGRRHMVELSLPNTKVRPPRPRDQHGTYEQIPPDQRGKLVVSVVRDPLARLRSHFQYGWWRHYPPGGTAAVRERFPAFPALSLEEYLELEQMDALQRISQTRPHADVGLQTVQFIQMFFKDPGSVLRELNDEYLDSDRFLQDIGQVRFIRNENLSEELHQLLLDCGYGPGTVRFILEHERVNSSIPQPARRWHADIIDTVRRRERLLFRIYRSLGFTYGTPGA
jgi:hypothetical protein